MISFTGQANQEFELIEKGDYEVTLSAEWAKKKNNPDEKYINCKFEIRKDVEQAFGGRIVFDSIYQNAGTGDYNKSKINGILGAIPNAKLNFESYDELIQYLNGKNMIVTIEIDPANQYHDKDKNQIKYLSYRQSACDEGLEQPSDEDIKDDGFLPF